jgi:hypothetical protein
MFRRRRAEEPAPPASAPLIKVHRREVDPQQAESLHGLMRLLNQFTAPEVRLVTIVPAGGTSFLIVVEDDRYTRRDFKDQFPSAADVDMGWKGDSPPSESGSEDHA